MRAARFVAIAVLAIVAVISDSCANSDEDAKQSDEITNIDDFDPVDYWDVWDGAYSLVRSDVAITQDEWEELVERQSASGLGSLDQEERDQLLQGSMKAYLILVESTTREIAVDGVGLSSVFEQYRKEDQIHTGLSAREELSDNLDTFWPDVAYPSDSAIHAKQFDDGSRWESWILDVDDEWTCESSSNGAAGVNGEALEWYTNMVQTVIDGDIAGEETFAGRDAVRLETGGGVPDGRVVWLDEQALLPIGFYLPALTALGSPARTVRVRGLNVDREVERPQGTCVER